MHPMEDTLTPNSITGAFAPKHLDIELQMLFCEHHSLHLPRTVMLSGQLAHGMVPLPCRCHSHSHTLYGFQRNHQDYQFFLSLPCYENYTAVESINYILHV